MKRVAIYLRVSTSKQETSNQRRELEAVAARSGWQIVKIFEDAGISGAKGRDQRPGLDAMMKAVNAREFDLVAAWSVDRLGRSLTDLLATLQGLHEKGRRPLPSSAGAGHVDHCRQGDVSDAGSFRRVRARHHTRAGQRWAGKGQGEWHQAGAAPSKASRRGAHPPAPKPGHGHPEDRPDLERWHKRRATGRWRDATGVVTTLSMRYGPALCCGDPLCA